MAIYRFSASIVSRGAGQSVIAKAAYNARAKLRDERTGELKDYSRAGGLLFSGIFAPNDAPAWTRDREKLWNAVERREDASTRPGQAQLARDIELALPHELTDQQRKLLVTDFVREQFLRKGMIADVNIHAPGGKGDPRNYHAHILVTMREIGPDGFGEKVREWNSRKQFEHWREAWEKIQNRYLERHGHDARVDRHSLEAQGIDREPTIHRGPHVDAMQRKGMETERGNAYRETFYRNLELKKLKRELGDVQKQIAAVEREQRQPRPFETRAGSREEKKWPTMPPKPERKHWTDFEKAGSEAGHDKRPENLKGAAAHIWTAWRQSHTSKVLDADVIWPNPHQSYKIDAKAFAAALDEKGIAFAVVTKQEAERSHREAEFAKAVGNYAPRYKETEIVAVTGPRLEYRRNGEMIEPRRVYKLDQSLAKKFVATLDNRSKLQGIDATKQALNERAQERSAHWQSLRLENAIRKARAAPARAAEIRVPSIVKKAPLREVGKTLDIVGNVFEAFFAPKLTPEQIRQGEIAAQKREAEAEHSIDLSKYTALRAQERQREENEREAERRQHRDRGGRER